MSWLISKYRKVFKRSEVEETELHLPSVLSGWEKEKREKMIS